MSLAQEAPLKEEYSSSGSSGSPIGDNLSPINLVNYHALLFRIPKSDQTESS